MAFRLTKNHVRSIFAPLASTDAATRGRFFASVAPDVTWTCTGKGHALAGTRTSLAAHNAATFERCGKHLTAAIKFTVIRVIVDAEPSDDGWWAVVELVGESTTKTGKEYNNEYAWLTRFNDDGVIVELRSYFDTVMSDKVLEDA